MLKFHIAIDIWIESYFCNEVKAKEKTLFLQTGNITESKKLKIF